MKEDIWNHLLRSEKKARASRLNRFFRNPLLYTSLLTYRYILFPFLKKDVYATAIPFYGFKMKILLPSGTDILLNGIKSHDSEIRLSKFLTLTLNKGGGYLLI